MKLVLLLLLSAAFAGCAGQGAPAEGTVGHPGGRDGSETETDGLPESATRRDILLLPGEVVSWHVTTPGAQNLDVRFRVVVGVVDVTLSGPGTCDGFHLETFTVAYPNGAMVKSQDCGVLPPGTYLLGLHAGEAAFQGAIELTGGWFEAGQAATSETTVDGAAPTDEREILVRAGQPVDLVVRGQGKAMRLVIGMYSGASLGGEVTAPTACEGDDLSSNVLAASLTGQALAVARCTALAPGTHTFHLDPGNSAFYGYAKLYDARFA